MEEYGKFICISEEGKRKLESMSETKLNIMADVLSSNIRKAQWKLEDEMLARKEEVRE